MTATHTSAPTLQEALSIDHEISRDLRSRLARYGSLSERQIELAYKLYDDFVNAVPVPTGDGLRLTGSWKSVQWRDSAYGIQLKGIFHDDTGFKVWGTVPAAVRREAGVGDTYNVPDAHRNLPGALEDGKLVKVEALHVSFTANVVAADGDPNFGFYSRPRDVEISDRIDREAQERGLI